MAVSIEEVKSFILSKTDDLQDDKVRIDIQGYLDSLKPRYNFPDEKKKAKEWLEWAGRLKDLKIVRSSVPVAVLPHGYKGELIDVKVDALHCPDDKIYDENEKIRQRVARGNCFLHIKDGPQNGTTCVVYALKKFSGGLGDDDDRDNDDNLAWKKYFTKPLESTDRIIATKKANGEAAHFSCQLIDGQFVLCGGSKNVHLIFRRKEDIARYGEPRYRIAREVCETIWNALEEMDSKEKVMLLSFLSHTHFTAVFEILSPDHQHIENFSHFTRNVLKFITWTETNIDASKDGENCTVPPHVSIEIARALMLDAVDYDVITMPELDKRMCQIRKGYNYEGEVLYFLDEKCSVIGLLKKKTIWYILCRATREKVKYAARICAKSPEKFSVSSAINKIEKRMDEIQSWLGLDSEGLRSWKALSGNFCRWVVRRVEDSKTKQNEVADKFPVLWSNFLEETNSSDEIQFTWQEPKGSDD